MPYLPKQDFSPQPYLSLWSHFPPESYFSSRPSRDPRDPRRSRRPRYRRRVATGLVLILTAACAEDERAGSALIEHDSAGISIVSTGGPGWTSADAWTLELDLDVGSADGPDAFGVVRDVAPRSGGGFWVVDGLAQRVRGFDDGGAEVIAFGRKGMGPGEMMAAGAIGEAPGGALVVGGTFPPQLHEFDADGTPIGTALLSPESFRKLPEPGEAARPPLGPSMASWQFAADGSAFAQAMTLDAPVDEIVRTDVLLRVDDVSAPVRLADWSSPVTSGGPEGELHMFQPTAAWSPLPDGGVWLTPGERYELRRIDRTGAVRRILRRSAPRTAVTDRVASRLRASLEEEARDVAAREMLDRAVWPDSLPATLGLWVSAADETLWVGVVDADRAWDAETANACDVFWADGRYAGRVPLPDGFRPTRVTADHVYGIWRDDLDVSHARRYRIVREGSA